MAYQPINCQCFHAPMACLHPSAPRPFFGKPICIIAVPPSDIRLRDHCSLREMIPRPSLKPTKPPRAD